MAPHGHVERHLRRLTSYQASPRLVVTGSATLVITLTTYLPRLIAVSGYRGLRGELRWGLTEFLFHSVPGPVGVPSIVIRRADRLGNSECVPGWPDRFRCTRMSRVVVGAEDLSNRPRVFR
jgi:hypothetical protein